MISIYFNNEERLIASAQSLHDLLRQTHHLEQHFAVAMNNQLVPRSAYITILLKAGDRVDIIVPMQGG